MFNLIKRKNMWVILLVVLIIILLGLFTFFMTRSNKPAIKQESLPTDNIVIMIFYSLSCGACKMIKPEWDKLKKYKNFVYEEYEISSNEELAKKYAIVAVPTILAYRVKNNIQQQLIYQHPLGQKFDSEVFISKVNSLSGDNVTK